MSHDMAVISQQLRQAGYRVTPQRRFILDAVCALGEHVTPEAVREYARNSVPSLNRATVYRTLHFLTERRILRAAQLADGRLGYELAGPEPHHHLVCRTCARSFELSHAALHAFYKAMEAQYDFVIDMDHVSFFGQCTECRVRAEPDPTRQREGRARNETQGRKGAKMQSGGVENEDAKTQGGSPNAATA